VFFRQVLHNDLGCASYVVADTSAGLAAIVDPRWDIDEYLELAAAHGFEIAHVVETHNHADHVSGRARLVEATGAQAWIHRLANATYDHTAAEDGDEVEIGAVTLRFLHAPGHRPEHSAIVVIDGSRSQEPCAVLTGDSLFVNDVARPDLAIEKREGAGLLFDSLQRIAGLGDAVEVYPGHTGGSLCGSARMSERTSSTVGYERINNPLLQIGDRGDFVDTLVRGLPPQPPNFRKVAERNRTSSPPPSPPPQPLAPRVFEDRLISGALVVDGRPSGDYDAAHIPGSIGVTLASTGFGTKVAWLIEEGQELLLVSHDDAETEQMADLLGAVGARPPDAFLAGGFAAWRGAGLPIDQVAVIDIDELRALRDEREDLQVLDVREDDEWEEMRIPGSAHLPYHDLVSTRPPLDAARPVAVICSSGKRSALAVGLLQRQGFADILHVTPGGVGAWAARGYPTETGAPAIVA
jgi:hydroxyacylglutathione hydrolase